MNTIVALIVTLTASSLGGVQTGQLLGLQSSGSPGNNTDGLFEIDIDQGDATLIEHFGASPSEGALAVGPDGTLYAAFAGIGRLVIVDPESGDVTDVGPFGIDDVSGLAFAPDGILYGYDDGDCQLITVDVETGQGTPLAPVGFFTGGGLSFAPDGTLFAVGWILFGEPTLWTIDLETGETTEIGPLGEGPFGEALDTSLALSFVGEQLFANATTDDTGLGGLYELDPATGDASFVGHYGDEGTETMGGMAFLPGTGDVDRDGDVDSDDFDIFVSCFTGPEPEEELPVGCLFLDTDDDGDIDCDDWIEFINAWTEDTDPPTFDECPPCEGDANGDGTVDPLDSGFVLARFGCPVGEGDPNCDLADQNGDGAVDPLDVGFVLARFGRCD